MKRTSVWLGDIQLKKLAQLAKRTGIGMAEWIRRFVDDGLKREEKSRRE